MQVVRYSLDLELEQAKDNIQTPDSHLDSPKIIQIGVVFFDVLTGQTIDHKTWYINIKVPLSKFIQNLTGITQKDVDNGIDIETAYQELVDLIKHYKAFKQPITWGAGDLAALQNEVNRRDLGRSEMNVKALWQALAPLFGFNDRGGLSKSMKKMNLQFKGRVHDATCDAYNTARFFTHLTHLIKKGYKN